MIISVVGCGGKTTLIHRLAKEYRAMGKHVFVTTSTHMYIEKDTCLSEDAEQIIMTLQKHGYVMAGKKEGCKISALSYETYQKVCAHADIVLIEADGSAGKHVKFPNACEPVIFDNTAEIIIVCNLTSVGSTFKECAFRPELVKQYLGVSDETQITPAHIQQLVRGGYIEKMKTQYPDKHIQISPVSHDTLLQRALAGLIKADLDVTLIKEEWFAKKGTIFICGGGHVAKELADFACKLDFRVKVMDDRADFACKERFPFVDEIICDSFNRLEHYLEDESYYVVVTRGHRDDYTCVQKILRTCYRYLGMIGSRKKVAKTFEMLSESLRNEGRSDDILKSIHAPIGLPIGAANPGEIAISILAEIIQEKNKIDCASVSSELLNYKGHGTLCIIIEKNGSSPRGKGSMMIVHEHGVIDSIGGGNLEASVIEDAAGCNHAYIKDYHLDNEKARSLGMICGGDNKVLFIPI